MKAPLDSHNTTLLALSRTIATVRHKGELLSLLIEQLQPTFGFYDCGLFVFNQDKTTLEDWTVSMPSISPSAGNSIMAEQVAATFSYQGSVWEMMVDRLRTTKGPVLHTYSEPPPGWQAYVQAAVMEQVGYQESLLALLQIGGDELGIFAVNSLQKNHFQKSQFDFFQQVSDQLAVALANILANEEIHRRDESQRLELALVNAINQESNWEGRSFALVKTLESFFPLDYLVISVKDLQAIEHSISYQRIGFAEWRIIHPEDFGRMARLSPKQYDDLLAKLPITTSFIQNETDFVAYCSRYPLERLRAETFTLQSCLVLPVALRGTGQFTLSLYSLQAHAYSTQQLTLLAQATTSLRLTLDNVLAHEEIARLSERLVQENTYLQEELNTTHHFDDIIGQHQSLQAVFRSVGLVASTDTTVLITGESGTGKELITRAIHSRSPRQSRALIKLNCATLPKELIESELFGHEKGAFTGAHDKRIGKFELANGGTIFLDEIGELPLELQAKLLRVLQEKEFERLGGRSVLKTNVRIIAATNRNLEEEVAQGRFRLDLYYRLSVFPIHLPPLRERREDIPLLATFFAHKFSQLLGKPYYGIDEKALQELVHYDWPGNIRELENLVEQAVIVCQGKGQLVWARSLVRKPVAAFRASSASLPDPASGELSANVKQEPSAELGRMIAILEQTKGKVVGKGGAAEQLGVRPYKLEEAERIYLVSILKKTGGRIRGEAGAAELLGLKPTTLESRIARLGIKKEHI